MDTMYGSFQDNQLEEYKRKMHKDLFWLLLYQDPETKNQYPNVDFEKYFTGIMKKINGLNELLFFPTEIIDMMSLLQAAYQESKSNKFNYKVYRKLILDAHALVDKIGDDDEPSSV